MKGFLLTLSFLFLALVVSAQKDCRHSEYEQNTIAAHPELSRVFSQPAHLSANGEKSAAMPAIITIPVVVHILYNNTEQNIPDEQVQSQIDALNRDFRGLNADRKKAPAYFAAVSADCGIEFKLARKDPRGNFTNGIVRKWTSIQWFGLDDRAKTNSRGGDDAWDADQYLNIWVCNLAGGILGYSSTPGSPAEKDGVTISTAVFGTLGRLSSSFSMGRTATHEVGHWLNLRHIWGDTYCGDDKVEDTPPQRSSNNGCPSGKRLTCGNDSNGDMYMNFMDLTDDACMYMFTNGQRERMRALFEAGGVRSTLLKSKAFDTTVMVPPTAEPQPAQPANNGVQLHLFPNPVTSTLSISVSEGDPVSKKEVIIYNHVGKPVLHETLSGNSRTFNISQLKPGLYYIHFTEGSTTRVSKFIKL